MGRKTRGQEEVKIGEGQSARGNWKHMQWSGCGSPPLRLMETATHNKDRRCTRMVLGPTAKVMIYWQCFVTGRQCFMEERWQLYNTKQMQMTQCAVYCMRFSSIYCIYCSVGESDPTQPIIIVANRGGQGLLE